MLLGKYFHDSVNLCCLSALFQALTGLWYQHHKGKAEGVFWTSQPLFLPAIYTWC
jgi:hypothetical protein